MCSCCRYSAERKLERDGVALLLLLMSNGVQCRISAERERKTRHSFFFIFTLREINAKFIAMMMMMLLIYILESCVASSD